MHCWGSLQHRNMAKRPIDDVRWIEVVRLERKSVYIKNDGAFGATSLSIYNPIHAKIREVILYFGR
jgi:hypothetical protein